MLKQKKEFVEFLQDYGKYKKGDCIEFDILYVKFLKENKIVKTFTLEEMKDPSFFEKVKVMEENKIEEINLLASTKEDVAEQFYKINPYFYDKSGIFWFWNKDLSCYEIKDEYDFINILKENAEQRNFSCVSNKYWNEIIKAMKLIGRQKIPKDAPLKWVQFKDKAISLESGNVYSVTPDYFFTNPIPFEIGKSTDTPVMDKLFSEWVTPEEVTLLYEMIAYCCYRDYPIHRIFCLVGSGRNGKSTFLSILRTFIGLGNFTSSELDSLIESRFESFKLYKKLCCIMGETNFGVMTKTSILKKLSGNDLIGAEMKGKMPFDMVNYAKMFIASNSMPTTMDSSDGFYRRFLTIEFNNEFKEGKDILKEIPMIEYNNLALKIKEILPNLLKNGGFTGEGSIEQRKKKYIQCSNPVSLFLLEECYIDNEGFVKSSELYSRYVSYLLERKKRKVTMKEFKDVLENEGYFITKEGKNINGNYIHDRFINGIVLKKKDKMDKMDSISIPPLTQGNEYRVVSILSNLSKNNEETIEEPLFPMEWDDKKIVFHKCSIEHCNIKDCNFDKTGTPYCYKHWELIAQR